MNGHSLKLITLNIWGGHVEKPLYDFLKSAEDIDIFCFQEIYRKAPAKISNEERYINLDSFSEIQTLLPNHQGYFRPVVNGIYGIAMFIKKELAVIDEGERIIHANDNYIGVGPTHHRILQYANIMHHNKELTVVNVHGLWNGMGKTDTKERINQSQMIKEFLNSAHEYTILCGDFNLRPDTESLKILESGMNNHIIEHDIKSTRTSFYPGDEKFADYILTSQNIAVNTFKVLPDEVSDHAPIFIDFRLKESR